VILQTEIELKRNRRVHFCTPDNALVVRNISVSETTYLRKLEQFGIFLETRGTHESDRPNKSRDALAGSYHH
jgi:hypothetical protein